MSSLLAHALNDCAFPGTGAHGVSGLTIRAVVAQLADRAEECGSSAYRPDKEMARRTGLAASTIRKGRYAAEALGLIVKTRAHRPLGQARGCKPPEYRLDLERLRQFYQGTDHGLWRRISDRAASCRCCRPAPAPVAPPPPRHTPRPPRHLDRPPADTMGRPPGRAHNLFPSSKETVGSYSKREPDPECAQCHGTGLDLHHGGHGTACRCWATPPVPVAAR